MKDKNLNTAQAWLLVGGLSKPGKMPGWSIGCLLYTSDAADE